MRAAVVERYGPPEVVTIKDVPTPVPGDNELLVKVRATTVNSGDVRVRALRVPAGIKTMMRLSLGFNRPKQQILGFEGAGDVVAVGSAVTAFKPGDRVVGSHGFRFGLHAEFATFSVTDAIVPIPDSLGYEEAVALCFGGATTLFFFREGGVKAGETLLVNGASGAVGVMAVQLGKHLGAEVTAVCSAANADLVRGLGADHVIAYDREDFTRNGKTYDVIMDNVGNAPYPRVKGSLSPTGRFLMVIFADVWQMISARWTRQVVAGEDNGTAVTAEAYGRLMTLAAEGVIRPVIDSRYPFERIVEAHRRVEGGHKVGSVVVTFPE